MPEKLYFIYNPLNGSKDWVSEREFKIGSQKLRDVFGVLYLSDVLIMLQYNAPFKESIMKEFNLTKEEMISLHHVCRMITKAELMEFITKEVNDNASSARNDSLEASCPSTIELKDGFFIWNEEKSCYDETAEMKTPRCLQKH